MRRLTALLVVALAASALSGLAGASPTPHLAPLDASVVSAAERLGAGGVLDLVISLDRVADRSLTERLARLGSWSKTFRHVPVAAVRLPVGRLSDVARLEEVRGVFLNQKLDYYLKDTARLMNTRRAWEDLGVTGKGVTVAILDTGVDFNHPDLAPAMRANVKLPGYGAPLPVLPIEGLQNSDTTSGHGTHVAGIVAGRGLKSDGELRGMGHGADLVGIGAGDALYIFTVIEGFDWLIEHKDEYGIRAVNNSWGTEFQPFNPDEPVNVATKAVSDAGVAVLFAMGNSADEMSMNPYAMAPWVIPVAAGSKTGGLTDFSSGGIEADTMGLAFRGVDVRGDPRHGLSMGIYHPAVTGTGDNVVSTRALASEVSLSALPTDATTMPPDRLPYYTTLSGTSMATPAVTGVVALLVEANPSLTPAQLRQVLQITAKPIPNVPFHRQGYGYVDASGAVDLARAVAGLEAKEMREALDARQAQRDREVLAGLAHPEQTIAFTDAAPTGPGSVEHAIQVAEGTARLKVVVSGPSTMLFNVTTWDLEVFDASGAPVVGIQPSASGSDSGSAVLDLDLHQLSADPGEASDIYEFLDWGAWTVRASSNASTALPVSVPIVDDFSAKRTISMAAATFGGPAGACAAFVPSGTTSMRLQSEAPGRAPDPARPDHTYVGAVPGGSLGSREPARSLSGTFGAVTSEIVGREPRFVTEPLAVPLTLGGEAKLETWIGGNGPVVQGLLLGTILDISPDGTAASVARFPEAAANAGAPVPEQTEVVAQIAKPYTIAAGHKLGLDIGITFLGTVANTLYFDSDAFPSGLTITTGRVDGACLSSGARPEPAAAGAGGEAAGRGASGSDLDRSPTPAAGGAVIVAEGTDPVASSGSADAEVTPESRSSAAPPVASAPDEGSPTAPPAAPPLVSVPPVDALPPSAGLPFGEELLARIGLGGA